MRSPAARADGGERAASDGARIARRAEGREPLDLLALDALVDALQRNRRLRCRRSAKR
jgi:hypothetical protein